MLAPFVQHPPLFSLPLSFTCVPFLCLSWRPPECQPCTQFVCACQLCPVLDFSRLTTATRLTTLPLQSGFSRTLLTPSRGFDPGIFHFPDPLNFPDTCPTPYCRMRRSAPPFFSLACLIIADCAAGIDSHRHWQSKQVAPAVEGREAYYRAKHSRRGQGSHHPLCTAAIIRCVLPSVSLLRESWRPPHGPPLRWCRWWGCPGSAGPTAHHGEQGAREDGEDGKR